MSVGYMLYREILDYAPGDWSSGERLVALVIADDAKDATRHSWIPNELLCKRTGMSPVGVRKALQKLASRGYELRVGHGKDATGREVYAVKGHRVDYLVPPMSALYGDPPVSPSACGQLDVWRSAGIAIADPHGDTPGPYGDPAGPYGDPPVSPLPSVPLSIPSTEEADLDSTPVEGARERSGQERLHLNGWAGPIEQAAFAAIHRQH